MPNSQLHVVSLDLGVICVTRSGTIRINKDDFLVVLGCLNWGDRRIVELDVTYQNYNPLRNGFRILSAYVGQISRKFWIVTKGGRSTTTIKLSEEY